MKIMSLKKYPFLNNNYLIWRFMIDRNHQNKGYGKAAMQLALDFIRTWPCGEAEYCWLSYEPENTKAKALYEIVGCPVIADDSGIWEEGDKNALHIQMYYDRITTLRIMRGVTI